MPYCFGSLALVLISLLFSSTVISQEIKEPEKQVSKVGAAELFAAGEYKLALAAYEERLKTDPENQTLLYNAGQSAFMIGENKIALEKWLALEKLASDDFVTKEKLIQTYSNLKLDKDVAKRITDLTKLRSTTKDAKYKTKRSFCRDQFLVDEKRVIVHQHFDYPKDEIEYSAYLVDEATGQPEVTFRLWSSKVTNAIAKEHGELKDDERYVHIDEYQRDGTSTNYYNSKAGLSYADFKKRISEIIKKR